MGIVTSCCSKNRKKNVSVISSKCKYIKKKSNQHLIKLKNDIIEERKEHTFYFYLYSLSTTSFILIIFCGGVEASIIITCVTMAGSAGYYKKKIYDCNHKINLIDKELKRRSIKGFKILENIKYRKLKNKKLI